MLTVLSQADVETLNRIIKKVDGLDQSTPQTDKFVQRPPIETYMCQIKDTIARAANGVPVKGTGHLGWIKPDDSWEVFYDGTSYRPIDIYNVHDIPIQKDYIVSLNREAFSGKYIIVPPQRMDFIWATLTSALGNGGEASANANGIGPVKIRDRSFVNGVSLQPGEQVYANLDKNDGFYYATVGSC